MNHLFGFQGSGNLYIRGVSKPTHLIAFFPNKNLCLTISFAVSIFKFRQKAEKRGNYAIMVWMKINSMMNLGFVFNPGKNINLRFKEKKSWHLSETYVTMTFSIHQYVPTYRCIQLDIFPDFAFVFFAPAFNRSSLEGIPWDKTRMKI